MKKHAKQAFGIFHDGLAVRMVHLVRDGYDVYLQSIDHTELDRYWYKILDDPSVSMVDAKTKEDRSHSKDEIQIDDFDNDYVNNYQLQPSERMLGSFDLRRGVIALNVYDDNIVRDAFDAIGKKEMDQFARSKMTEKQYKKKDWQSSLVTIGGRKQHWLHKGNNRLLDLIRDFGRTNHTPLFYQLADANDIVITDYFRVTYEDYLQRETLLVYLGQEYRKAFVFHGGEWTDTLKLQITQSLPEMEVISSKLALAIDSAQLNEPEAIVLCGDLVSTELIEHLSAQFPTVKIELFSLTNVIVSSQEEGALDYRSLSLYTIPIALAYKALNMDDKRFTPSNFLPSSIIEGQKIFKVAWHGFIVLFLIFAASVWGTIGFMRVSSRYSWQKKNKQVLEFTLAQKRLEAAEIQKIRGELDEQERNIDLLVDLLDGKNYWAELLSTLNRAFSNHPISWLTNLKREGASVAISGVTTRRENIITFASLLPDGQISKVSNTKIRNNTLWVFDIICSAPKVDWKEDIEADALALIQLNSERNTEQKAEVKTEKVVPVPESDIQSKTNIAKTIKNTLTRSGKISFAPLDEAYIPYPNESELGENEIATKAYYTFVAAINKGNVWEYRDLGQKFTANYPSSKLLSLVRWWLAYRMYSNKDYKVAGLYLEPGLRVADRFYPYYLLLQARIDYSLGNSRYKEWYGILQTDYARNPLSTQARLDLDLIEGGQGND